LIDYVPFDMPSSRPGKMWKERFFLESNIGKARFFEEAGSKLTPT
jgi:hypothetical protein